jgi:hypothetical protein
MEFEARDTPHRTCSSSVATIGRTTRSCRGHRRSVGLVFRWHCSDKGTLAHPHTHPTGSCARRLSSALIDVRRGRLRLELARVTEGTVVVTRGRSCEMQRTSVLSSHTRLVPLLH